MKKTIYRINDYSILRFIDNDEVQNFFKIKDEISLDSFQYVEPEHENYTVWDSGIYSHRLNKTYSNTGLFYQDPGLNKLISSYNVGVLIKRGVDWESKFGIHVLIKSAKTGDIFVSKMLINNDFKVTGKKELIDGVFWLEEAIFNIPKINDIMLVQITSIDFENITYVNEQIGYVSYYPTEFIPLIDEKPIPDFLQSQIFFDNSHFINVRLITTENKTVKQSILDYFDIELSNIEISHVINYGNDIQGFKTLRITNEDDKYLPINIGLNFKEFVSEANDNITIFVSTEILVDNKLMKRESSITTNILETINPLIVDKIIFPITNYPVEVKFENIINNTVIDTPKETKILSIFQPIFVEMIAETIKIENKFINFENINFNAILQIIGNDIDLLQIIYSKPTSSGKYYFDLSELKPITKETTYELLDDTQSRIIGKGKVIL